jgi:hypothetical protein
MRNSLGVWAGVLLAVAWAGTARAQAPEGAEFRVNGATANDQTAPAVASDASGNFVVVWQGYGQDGDHYGIRGRRFTAAGVPRDLGLGSVNSYTTGSQQASAVAADANGNFVVTWESYQDGSEWGIFGQRFDFFGARLGGEFQVNTYTTGRQYHSGVASDANGNFVVVWGSIGQDGSNTGIFGQRYDASGAPLGVEFPVNTYTTQAQGGPAVAADAAGNFVVVWTSLFQDGSVEGVFGQRFDPSGVRVGGEFRVNTYITGNQAAPSVAMDPSGRSVVVWGSFQQVGTTFSVFGQRYDAAGVLQGGEFQVNTTTSSNQLGQKVSMDETGAFTVVWYATGGSGLDVFGQRFDASGAKKGAEFRVNSYTTSGQSFPAVARAPDGDFVVAWDSDQDGSGYGIFGQRYGDILFEDGFESGDLSRWTSAVTDGTDLSVTGGAAQSGTAHGMNASVNDTNPLYVQDDTPDAEVRYRARLYLDPSGFDPGEASGHQRVRICLAFDDAGVRVVSLVLKRLAGAYSVEARVRQNDGSRVDTGFSDTTAAPHLLEFDWRRSSASGAADGVFTLRVDNVIVSTLTGLDNDTLTVGYVRVGAMSVKAGAAGTLHFDQFESRRRSLIGPE